LTSLIEVQKKPDGKLLLRGQKQLKCMQVAQ
jgi:uncharacterized protein YeaC (DUF1315 family)